MKRLLFLALIVLLGCSGLENSVPDSVPPLFDLVSSQKTGVEFSNNITATSILNIFTFEYLYNGGGVGIGDINNDELPDIYFTSNQEENKLYLNKGNFQFEDITMRAGVAGAGRWTNGVTMADVNSDGLLDIYVSNSGRSKPELRRNELFINNGDLTFTEKAAAYGIDSETCTTQSIFLDIDNDNDLDLFLLNRPTAIFNSSEILALRGHVDPEAGDVLFRNDGGKYVDISAQAGIYQNGLGYGLGVVASDLNKDGFIDIYVTNDYVEPDYMYINNGDGTFTDIGRKATKHMSNFGMGVDAADINNDGWSDVFVADMSAPDNYRQKTNMKAMDPSQFYQAVYYGFHHQYMYNTLQLNNQDLTFSEVAQLGGLSSTDWSWTSLIVDLDNDTWNDIVVTNGFRKDFTNKDFSKMRDKKMGKAIKEGPKERMAVMEELLEKLPETKIGNFIFRNKGDLNFEDKSEDWNFSTPSYSNGAAVADLDNDGDLDMVVNNIDEKAFIYRNNTSNNYLRLKLNGPEGNTSGIGTKLTAFVGDNIIYREHVTTRGYQSSQENRVHFGLGNNDKVDRILVEWPDGKSQEIASVASNQLMSIDYQNAVSIEKKSETSHSYLTDVTKEVGLKLIHKENFHDDFAGEVLLPHKMSQFGPALAVGDVNADGLDDFFLGGATGLPAKVMIQNKAGSFSSSDQPYFWSDAKYEDVGASFLDIDGDNDLDLYVSSGGNEYFPNNNLYQDRLYVNDGGIFSKVALPKIVGSNSVVRPFDIDQDGDLDLFVGGRVNPMQYPTPAKSYILINDENSFSDRTNDFTSEFEKLGMITDAEWTNLNNDSNPELVVVGEWTAITVFELSAGKFINKTSAYGLEEETGWWFSIEVSDFNGDGFNDLVAGNLGLNYKYKSTYEEPFHVYFNDFDGNGRGDIVLGYYNDGDLFPLRGRQCSSQQMPTIAEKFETYDEFGQATLEEVYGDSKLEKSVHYAANTFASKVYINSQGKKFEGKNLPSMSQLSSINAFHIDDFNDDGKLDLLFAGNLYPVEVETIRNDASYGGLLLGDGKGNFNHLLGVESGFIADGDVKHLAPITIKNRKSIIVVRNDGPVSIYQPRNPLNNQAGSL
ncbi:MAG: VCBS repeat-containing protein [Ekhidna sp.]